MKIPFVDLFSQHQEVRAEIEAAFQQILETSAFIGGSWVANFEHQFAQFCGTQHAVACATGTDALKLALMAADIAPGDEVITVPNTFIATTEAITLVGAFPAFVDIDPQTYNLSPQLLEEFLVEQCVQDGNGRLFNRHTHRPITAILPVHLYGLPADMAPILQLAARYNLHVIEDACQAHGASYQLNGEWKQAGSLGDVAAFSFYPGKNLGAMGEGGGVTTNNATMAHRMKQWRDHGQREKYIHDNANGWNGRLDTLQCAILNIKLQKLAEWNNRRRQAAAWYRQRLEQDERIVLPHEPNGRFHVYHLFVVQLPDRETVRQKLTEQGIGLGLHYPLPLHLQPAYQGWGWQPGQFTATETAANHLLSLPMFPHLTEDQVDHVCRVLLNALA